MYDFIKILFLMSLKASILIFIIMLIKKIFNKYINAKIHFLVWLLIFIPLLIPVLPQSHLSIYNLSPIFQKEITVTPKISINDNYNTYNNESIDNYKNQIVPKDLSNNQSLTFKSRKTIFYYLKIENILFLIWISVFLFILLTKIHKTYQLNYLIRKNKYTIDLKIQSYFNQYLLDLNINTKPELVITDLVKMPCLIGINKPKILIPIEISNNFNNDEISLIILHELFHHKRKDILLCWIILIFQSIYWFNPIIWFGFSKMKNDMELACDGCVLSYINEKQHIKYGNVILSLVSYYSYNKLSPIATNFLQNKNEIKRRILMIKYNKQKSKIISLLIIFLVLLAGCSTLSSPEKKENSSITNSVEVVKPKNIETVSNNIDIAFDVDNFLSNISSDGLNSSDAATLIENKEAIIGKPLSEITVLQTKLYTNKYYLRSYYVEEIDNSSKNGYTNVIIFPLVSDEESSALYIYNKDDIIDDIKIDEFNGSPNLDLEDSRFVIISHTYLPGSDFDSIDLKNKTNQSLNDKYRNTSFNDFKQDFNLIHGSSEAIDKQNNLIINLYPLVSKDSASVNSGLYVLSQEDTIISIFEGKPDIDFNELTSIFSLK